MSKNFETIEWNGIYTTIGFHKRISMSADKAHQKNTEIETISSHNLMVTCVDLLLYCDRINEVKRHSQG